MLNLMLKFGPFAAVYIHPFEWYMLPEKYFKSDQKLEITGFRFLCITVMYE